MLELDSADSENQVLAVLCIVKETEVTRMYGKKAAKSANKGTEAAEEPTGSLTVSMPPGEFKWAITQHGFSVNSFVEDFDINLLAINFLWLDIPLFSTPAKIFSKNVVAVVDLGSSGVVVSCGCVAHLKLEPDN